MNEFVVNTALYVAKVLLISGVLFGYYRVFLRNRGFHRFNRYFLLGTTLVSLVAPLVHLNPYTFPLVNQTNGISSKLYAIVPGVWKEPSESGGSAVMAWSWWSAGVWITIIYGAGVLAFCGVFVRQLCHIRRLPKKYPGERVGQIDFFITREPGTPFSFLNRLFWNEKIDISSPEGHQIFLHECYHIRERHTLDLLWLKTILVVCWVNPFFYLIYREIRTIHEFLADRHAAGQGDCYAYAELLVWHSILDRPLSILHPFFQSSIKRRITMLTQLQSAKPGYWRRMMVVPIVFLLFSAFSVKRDMIKSGPGDASLFTVVIDAGHGGSDAGAIAAGTKEKDINLALALKVKRLSPEYHINVVLTRKTDELAGGKGDIRSSLEYRAEMARDSRADLFVSLHVNNAGGATPNHGFSAYVYPENAHYAESAKLGSALLDAVKGTYAADNSLHQPTQGVYLLRHTVMPSVLLECGYIDNPTDLAFIRDSQNQEKIARDILTAIRRYQQSQPAAKQP